MTFCYESHPLNLGTITRHRLAMDAAPSAAAQPAGLIGDDALKQILDLLQAELDPETFKKVQAVVVANSKMAADDEPKSAPSKRQMTAEGFEQRGVPFLRSRGISEDDIDTARKLYGFKKPSVAEDSARRENARRRAAREYAARFPAAQRITTTDAPVTTRRTTVTPMNAQQAADYEKRFPDAARLR